MAAISGQVGAVYNNYSGTDKSKEISNFQSGSETWIGIEGTSSYNSSTYRLGSMSLSIADDDNVGELQYALRGTLTLNLEQFASGDASDTSDYIYVIFYVSDSSLVTDVTISFSSEDVYNGSFAYSYAITSVVDGWNYVKIKKSLFNNNGMSDWSDVSSILAGWTSKANAQNEYVLFQAMYLIDDSYDLILSNNTAYTMENIGLFYNWGIDIDAGLTDATTFDSAGWAQSVSTVKRFTSTSEKYWANGDSLSDFGSTLALLYYLTTTSGYRYEGSGKLSTNTVDLSVDDLVNESIEFNGEGELYYTALQIINS